MQATLQVIFPFTQKRLKIVLLIPFLCLRYGFRWVCILLREPLKGLQDDNQAAHHRISPNLFDVHHGPSSPAEAVSSAQLDDGTTPRLSSVTRFSCGPSGRKIIAARR